MKQTLKTAPTQSTHCHGLYKPAPKISTIRSQVLGPIKHPLTASIILNHHKTLKQSVKASRIKPLPHGVCRNSSKLVPTCSPRCVELLCFLARRNPTVRSPVNLERRCSLSKIITKCPTTASPPCLHVFSFFSISLPFSLRILFLFIPFLLSFLSFLLSFSFSHFSSHSPFNFSSLLAFLSHFDRMGQEKEISFSFPQSNCMAIIIPSLFFYFLISHYDLITYMVQCEPWNSFPTHG